MQNFPAMRLIPTSPVVIQTRALDPHLDSVCVSVLFEEESTWSGMAGKRRIVARGEPFLPIVDVCDTFDQWRVCFESR